MDSGRNDEATDSGSGAGDPVGEPDRDGRVDILGVHVSQVDLEAAVSRIATWIRAGTSTYVCVTGLHGIMESQRDEELRAIHNQAGMVTPDGMPLVWISRSRGSRTISRVAGSELLSACCEYSSGAGWRHFFYGGAPGLPELLAERLKTRWPRLEIVGTHSPPFRALTEAEDTAEVELIRQARPDIVWVGLSTPKQERWMARHVGQVAPVLIGVGAAFDFLAGVKPRAPGWMQRSGLEWVFRLMIEPRRLWRRYLNTVPFAMRAVLPEIARLLGTRAQRRSTLR